MGGPVTSGAGRAFALALFLAGLSACGGPSPEPGPAPSARADTGLDRMERLTLAANRCWFKSGDPAFRAFSLAPELSSFSGKPRFLLVPRGRPEARPLLVVEGRAGSTDVSWYGPLLDQPVARRIDADLDRWRAGGSACAA